MTELELRILRAAHNGGKHLVIRRCCTPRPLFRRVEVKTWLQIGDTRIDGEADKLEECLRNLEEENHLMDVGESRWVLSPEAKERLDEQE